MWIPSIFLKCHYFWFIKLIQGQKLSKHLLLYHCTYLYYISYYKNIVYIILFVLFVMTLGAVYVLGDYKDGRLGMDIAENQKVPKVLSSLPQIKLATCGSDNSFVITENSNNTIYLVVFLIEIYFVNELLGILICFK